MNVTSRKTLSNLAIISLILLIATQAQAEEKPSWVYPCWFSQFGLGIRSGVGFRENATGDNFETVGPLFGGQLELGVFRYKDHRAVVTGGYTNYNHEFEKGTREVRVNTKYQGRFDLSAGYDFTWKILIAGARAGMATTLVSTQTILSRVDQSVIGNEIVYEEPEEIDRTDIKGADLGFYASINIGIELGQLLFKKEDLIELKVQTEFINRDQRQEFYVLGAISFWPTSLKGQ